MSVKILKRKSEVRSYVPTKKNEHEVFQVDLFVRL